MPADHRGHDPAGDGVNHDDCCGEVTKTEYENYLYHLMLEVGNGGEEELSRVRRALVNGYSAPALASIAMGMAAMAHDLWTGSMTPDVIVWSAGDE